MKSAGKSIRRVLIRLIKNGGRATELINVGRTIDRYKNSGRAANLYNFRLAISLSKYMCIFCQIVSGEIPAYKVYEDAQVLAFLDINPVSPGHTLVITKAHYQNIEDTPAAELGVLVAAVKKIGRLVKDRLGVAGYNVLENNDPVAGQVIPHLHFHVIPRRLGDGHQQWEQAKYAPGEAEAIQQKLLSDEPV